MLKTVSVHKPFAVPWYAKEVKKHLSEITIAPLSNAGLTMADIDCALEEA